MDASLNSGMQTLSDRVENPPSLARRLLNHAFAAFLGLVILYLSLLITSQPASWKERAVIDRAIDVLQERGFEREAFMLRTTAAFRSSDNWLNGMVDKESAYAATNFPFEVVTIYPDFYYKTVDDTERAMILLHEAQHMEQKDEHEAYKYVWEHRRQLGWTQLTHGTTPTYVAIREVTVDTVPELFSCSDRLWDDCTEDLARR